MGAEDNEEDSIVCSRFSDSWNYDVWLCHNDSWHNAEHRRENRAKWRHRKVSGQTITTPGNVTLPREDWHSLLITKDGYKPVRINLQVEGSPLVWLDAALLLPGIIPGVIAAVVDMSTGATAELAPDKVVVSLEKAPTDKTSGNQNRDNIVERPDLSLSEVFKPLTDDKKVRICLFDNHPKLKARVMDGEETIGSVQPHDFICWERKPGPVTAVVQLMNGNKISIEVPTQGGRTYFLKFPHATFTLATDLIAESDAREFMKDCVPAKAARYAPFE